MVPMVLNHFLKIGFVIDGGGFYSYYNLKCIKLDKQKRIPEKKSFLCIQKTFNTVFKNGFNSTPTVFNIAKGEF